MKELRDKKRLSRGIETKEKKAKRVECDRINKRIKRKLETPEQIAKRNLSDRLLKAKTRRLESPEQKNKRNVSDRRCKAEARKFEAPEQTEKRRQSQKHRTTASRNLETLQQTEKRRQSQKHRTIASRKLETLKQTDKRRQSQKHRTTASRKLENPEQAEKRRQSQKHRSTASRKLETPEQTEKRRKSQKHRTTASRKLETPEQREKRRHSQKHRTTASRKLETPEQTEKRRQSQKHRTTASRKLETPEQTKKRRQSQKYRTTINRKSETLDKMISRKDRDRFLKAKLKSLETPEQSKKRKLSNKQTKYKGRSIETREQTAKRRKVEKKRIQHSRCTIDDLSEITRLFQKKVKFGPDFTCTVCHRMMYRQHVILFYKDKYTKLTTAHYHTMLEPFIYTSTDDRIWICVTCDRALKRGKMPRQAKANKLELGTVPPQLAGLNDVEVRLLSLRIPFMKLVALPRGKQKGIHGPAVNVPARLDTLCSLLPRLPQECEIIPMKLKRRLCYKGHYMYDSIRPQNMIDALNWLIKHNKHYCCVRMNNDWEQKWNENDPELWKALTGIEVEEREIKSETECFKMPLDKPCTSTSFAKCGPSTSDTFSHLEVLAKAEGYIIENVEGDGNCFYRAIGKQLELCGKQAQYHNNHKKLRTDLTNYLEANPKGQKNVPYKKFLTDRAITGDSEHATVMDHYVEQVPSEPDLEELRWQRYLQDMEEGAWADHIAVQGMADMLSMAIRVIATQNPETPLIKPKSGNVNDMLHLGLIGQSHYVSLIRDTDTQQIEIQTEPPTIKQTQNMAHSVSTKEPELDFEQKTNIDKSRVRTDSRVIDIEEYEYEQESKAFEISSKLRGLPLDTCLQAEDIDINKVLSIAPGEGAKPLNILTDHLFEEMSFPHKYPTGRGGFSEEREEKLTIRKFFNQRLLDVDGRFAKDVEYLLAAQYAVEHDQINNLQSIVIRQMPGRLYQGERITAGDLKNPDKLNQLVQKDHAYRLLKEVRGTPAYWQKVHYEVLAMIRQLGIPTWFLTLSAADMKWPEVIQIIARQYGNFLSEEEVSNLSWEEKCSWLRRNPVTAARHFQYRLDLFWNDFLKSKANPVGELVDYMIRIEFQARGSPHAHTILWIKGAPRFGTDPLEKVTQFIDKYQTCSIPINDLELQELVQLQTHVHSSSCIRKGSCRFGIPKFPSPVTIISREPDAEQDKIEKVKQANDIFLCINETIGDIDSFDDITLEQLLHVSHVSMDEYMEALQISKRGNTVVLKRTPQEMNINCYNPAVLRAWKANMDIQYILDAYACVMYVTSYMMKSERAMGELLKHVSQECRGDDIRNQLRKLGSVFLNHREVSSQEAVYRILSLPLKKLSRKCIFINTDPKNERVTMTKPLSSIQELENDEEDLYLTSLIDRYICRPDNLENMCLAEFAANYDVNYSSQETDDNDHTPNPLQEEHQHPCSTITLKDGLGKMQKRKQESVIRYPKYNIEKNSEKYYRAKLMLFVPWREENNIIGESANFQEQYRQHLEMITENETHYTKNGPSFEQAIQDLNEFGPPVHAFNNVAPATEQQRLEDEQEGFIEERHLEQQDLDENAELMNRKNGTGIAERFDVQADNNLMSSGDYNKKMQKLNNEQRNIVQYHRHWCKSVVLALKGNKPAPKAYRAFVSGPGGVGKSHVIELLKNDTIRLLRYLPSVQPQDILCLLTAPTGTAAFNISGMTIHSTFLIPVAMRQYRNLGADTLNTLRNKLNNVKVVIIDEISMVGANLFYQIHRRLEEIKGCRSIAEYSTFGDVTMIAVGDLYQLPPVAKSYVFEHPNDSYAKLQDPLWYQFKLAELNQIMRQKDDAEFAQLLNRVRTATCTTNDHLLLKSREINPGMKNYPIDVLHVFSTHKLVNKHNEQMLDKINEMIHTIQAIDSKKDRNSGIDIEFPEKSSETGGLETQLKVAVGCKVMLTYNIDVSDGLSNGATGTVSHIILLGNTVITILVEFDDPKVGIKARRLSQYRNDHPNSVPITRHEATFNIGVRKCINATRRQFPLRLSWASTIHKVQGLTTDSIVVSFEGKFFPGQAYVALSRVRRLSGLYILKFDPAQIHVDCAVSKEMERMRENPIICINEMKESDQLHLKVSHLNIRGVKSHIDDLTVDPLVKQSNVLCLCETFLQANDKLNGSIIGRNDMDIFRMERTSSVLSENQSGSGGVLLAAQKELSPVHLASNISKHLEYVAVQLKHNSNKLLIISLYRPPSGKVNRFLQEIDQVLSDTNAQNSDCIIVGDFNEDLLSTSCPILAYFQSKKFHQKTDAPTRDSGSLLDHTYTSGNLNVNSLSVHDTYYSDHDFVSFSIS